MPEIDSQLFCFPHFHGTDLSHNIKNFFALTSLLKPLSFKVFELVKPWFSRSSSFQSSKFRFVLAYASAENCNIFLNGKKHHVMEYSFSFIINFDSLRI